MSVPNRPLFFGTYPQRIDAKNRVILPAELRHAADREDDSGQFILTHDGPGRIRLYTAKGFANLIEEMMDGIDADADPDEADAEQHAIHLFMGDAKPISAGQQGRIVLPVDIKERAGLSEDIIFVGLFDHIKGFSPDAHAEFQGGVSPEEYQQRIGRLTDPRRRRARKKSTGESEG